MIVGSYALFHQGNMLSLGTLELSKCLVKMFIFDVKVVCRISASCSSILTSLCAQHETSSAADGPSQVGLWEVILVLPADMQTAPY